MKTLLHPCAFFCLYGLLSPLAAATHGSATWNQNPANGDWSTAENWTPAEVPTGTAFFDTSNITSLSISEAVNIKSIVFKTDASSFTITAANGGGSLTFANKGGVMNNSGFPQYFNGSETFLGKSSAGSNVVYTIPTAEDEGAITFRGSSDAGSAAIINEPAMPGHGLNSLIFNSRSSAGSSSITNVGQDSSSLLAATFFNQKSTAGQSTIAVNQGTEVVFSDDSTAANSMITADADGLVIFDDSSTAGAATLLANDWGTIEFLGDSDGGTAFVYLVVGGYLLIDRADGVTPVTIGALQGIGEVNLLSPLQIGSSGIDVSFDGGFIGSAGLTKVGPGRFFLVGSSPTFTGPVTVTDGILVATATRDSATGRASVYVNSGALGGDGLVAGAVFIGTGSGPGASLAPAAGGPAAALTIRSPLTFRSDGTYNCFFYHGTGGKTQNDRVTAAGVIISSGAQFILNNQGDSILTVGTIFTIIGNSAATPISGTFSNLPDGAIIPAGANLLQVNYEGGDGNDLTFTVVQ